MQLDAVLPKYINALLQGDRIGAREIIRKVICTGVKARQVYGELLIPAMKSIQMLHREDRVSILKEHVAHRINRFITDQVQSQLMPCEQNGKTAVVVCAETEGEELGGQVCADLLEASGWKAIFVGSGIPEDELIELIGNCRPELLVVYGSSPSGVPATRELIERIRDIGASPMMDVTVTGGIFDRVEGLWEEIQADYYAPDPVSLATLAEQSPRKVHLPRDPDAPKRRRRLVSAPAVAAAG